MGRHLLMVHTNAVAGRDEEYNRWYDDVHLAEVLQLPDFVGAQRFEVSAALPGGDPPPQRYLAIYEIEADDVDAALLRLREAAATMTISDALDRSSVHAFAVAALGDRVSKADAVA